VKGRIDHLSVDVAGHRLFMAALGNDTVEVFDVQANRHLRSIRGFGEPQGVLYAPASDRLFVANGTADRLDVLDAQSFKVLKRIESLPDADNVREDRRSGGIVVGYGKGALRLIDPASAESLVDIRLSGHPESFQLERNGSRVFVNVPTARHVAVVARDKAAVIATWDVAGVGANFPMALDEEGKRLFVGARSPALMLVYDTSSGRITAKLPICGDTDDLFYDRERRRVYVVCGAGKVEIFGETGERRLAREATVETSPRARTGLFVPEYGRLYVAAPAAGSAPARLLMFEAR
jgi:DNA-binding beta-propeller fold protein YncE